MKRVINFLIIMAFSSHFAFAKTDNEKKTQAEMMKAFQEYATPGKSHKFLEKMVGKWKYTSKWWESAEAKPEESSGTSTIKMILGGRFLQNETTGKAMGMPFQGLGLTGYNNVTGQYESLWLDTMGTGMTQGTGSVDEQTNTLKEIGEFSCPMTKGKKRNYRSEWQLVEKGKKKKLIFTMWGKGMDDEEYKQMEMHFEPRLK